MGPVIPVRQLAGLPLLMTTLQHTRWWSGSCSRWGCGCRCRAEIDSVDSIRELVLRGPWATRDADLGLQGAGGGSAAS